MLGYKHTYHAVKRGGLLNSDDVEDNLFREFSIAIERGPWIFAKSESHFARVTSP